MNLNGLDDDRFAVYSTWTHVPPSFVLLYAAGQSVYSSQSERINAAAHLLEQRNRHGHSVVHLAHILGVGEHLGSRPDPYPIKQGDASLGRLMGGGEVHQGFIRKPFTDSEGCTRRLRPSRAACGGAHFTAETTHTHSTHFIITYTVTVYCPINPGYIIHFRPCLGI